jgi:hypothetical protein
VAEITDGDREFIDDLCQMQRAGGEYESYEEHVLTRGQREQALATYRERCEEAARDAVARQAFAAGCYDCKRGNPVYLRASDDLWVHRLGTSEYACAMHHVRLALDPDGRLAGPGKDGRDE